MPGSTSPQTASLIAAKALERISSSGVFNAVSGTAHAIAVFLGTPLPCKPGAIGTCALGVFLDVPSVECLSHSGSAVGPRPHPGVEPSVPALQPVDVEPSADSSRAGTRCGRSIARGRRSP